MADGEASRELPAIISAHVPGPASLVWAERLRKVESPDTTFLSSDFPVFWTRGKGSLVWDDDGNRFLDLTSSFGVLGVGHCHPDVQAAIRSQSLDLIHGMGDVHPSTAKVLLLEKVVEHSPIPNSRVILGINGSDSVEAALKTALLATDRSGVLAFESAYHGLSYGSLEPTARNFFRDPFYAQRGRFVSRLPFGCDLKTIEQTLKEAVPKIGAVIVEPIQGRGGIRIPQDGWLTGIKRLCIDHAALLIFDEILTGWGRTGKWFASQHESVIPDLVCMGKTMGGGMPISACVGSADLLDAAWGRSAGEARHTYTFLGHPLTCSAAVASITAIERDNLVERSSTIGAEFLGKLQQLVEVYSTLLKSARGRGLMIGIEFIDKADVWIVLLAALRVGLILLPAGDNGDVIEFLPPFVITEKQIAWSLTTLDRIFCKAAHSKLL